MWRMWRDTGVEEGENNEWDEVNVTGETGKDSCGPYEGGAPETETKRKRNFTSRGLGTRGWSVKITKRRQPVNGRTEKILILRKGECQSIRGTDEGVPGNRHNGCMMHKMNSEETGDFTFKVLPSLKTEQNQWGLRSFQGPYIIHHPWVIYDQPSDSIYF